MSQTTALARLAPQMADYDLLGKVDWRPYLMFFQQPDFVSQSVTTDRLGFRRTLNGGALFGIDDVGDRPVNLLLGNSVAFGVGATSDDASLASRLAAHGDGCWLNFCGRAFGAMQELILFQAYRYRLPRIRRVVLCTGLNDLYLSYAPKVFDETFGVFFFSEVFFKAMCGTQARLSRKRSVLAAMLSPFYGDRIDYGRVKLRELPRMLLQPPPGAPAEPDYLALVAERRHLRGRIIDQLERTLEIWAALARVFGFELSYALQPMLPWTGKQWTPEERELVAEADGIGGRWHRILRAVLDDDHHRWYSARLSDLCRRLKIQFIDMNEQFRDQQAWLFLDRVHLNDAGQDLAARRLIDALGLKRGQAA